MFSRVKRMTYGNMQEVAKEIWRSTCILPSSTAIADPAKLLTKKL